MINTHKIICLDFESDSSDPKTCNPTQLAALAIHPRTLEIIPDSEFNSLICPPTIDDENYESIHKDTIEFHAKNQHITAAEVVSSWRQAPKEKVVWENFMEYLNKYHTSQDRKNMFTAPLIMGYNILGFDFPIIQRLCEKYGNVDKTGRQNIFYNRDKIDLMLYSFQWFENLTEPTAYNMDELRRFFGITTAGSHDALKDIRDTSEIFIRWQKLIRRTSERVKFKNAFKEEENKNSTE